MCLYIIRILFYFMPTCENIFMLIQSINAHLVKPIANMAILQINILFHGTKSR